ncbi:hypothetical protein O3P69_002802 [Scylla paramamosain]|uniref:Uncharacterized protein n=1 Tax=Scylla paramamosain TaxID=85552 RepID=A0AAW0UQ04_SCYPA
MQVVSTGTECELREAASIAREREVRNLKKAHWGLSLAYKYGRRLLNQDKFPEGNSPKEEWSSLQNILKQVLQNLDQQPWNSTENTAIRKKEQELMKSPIRKAQESVKSTSLLDTSMEDSDSDVLPRPQNGTEVKASRTGIRKKMQKSIKSPSIRKTRELTKMTSILDTSMEDSDIDILPSLQSSTEVTAPCTENTRIQRKMQQPIKSPIRKTQKPIKSASLLDTSMEDSDSEVLPSLQNGVEKTISHTVDTGIRKKTQDVSKSLSILDTSLEDSDEEPSLRPLASTAGHSFDVNLKGTEELPMVTSLKRDHSNSYAGTSKETSPINSYHLDEELRAILQKMRPHKKLEDIDTSLSGGQSPLPETGMPVPAMKQDFLGSLSDSEEEEKDEETEMHEQDKAGMCVIPRILTTQISEEFVARSHKGSSLLDDLDISTDTIDQEREDEKEEKDNQTQVPLPHFQSSQSFSFDMEECHPLPSPQTLASMSGEISKEQHTHCQSQSVDGDDNSMCGHQGDVPKVQNKVLLKEMRHLFGAVDDTTTISGRETEDSDHQSVGSAGKNDVLSMSGGAIHTELCQEGQASPDIQITENKLVEDIVNGSRSTAAQKEMNKEKEERSTEIEEENNGAALEGKNRQQKLLKQEAKRFVEDSQKLQKKAQKQRKTESQWKKKKEPHH